MWVTSEIDGKFMPIKLTPDELFRAYLEQEHIFDCEDVRDYFDAFDDDNLLEVYGMSRTKIEEFYDDIAVEMRRNINKYDMRMEDARAEAIIAILK